MRCLSQPGRQTSGSSPRAVPPASPLSSCFSSSLQALKDLALGPPKGSTLVLLQLDVTDPQSIKEAAKKAEEHLEGRGLNLLVNNAGIACDTTLDSETAQTMMTVYATNTVGPLRVSQAFCPLLKRAALRNCGGMRCSKAAIVNISSSYGSLSALEGWQWKQDVGYRCSKAALNMLTRCQARGYGCWGILCVSIHPGDVKTGLDVEQEVLSVASSTQAILQVLARLSASDNGSFLDWRGEVVPW
ncbi:C-signal isoform X1 [Pogona vitticeps]